MGNLDKKAQKAFGMLGCLLAIPIILEVLFSIVVAGMVAWVAVHFISKWW